MQRAQLLPRRRYRIRHACEPCRQKKVKCPAEKPICSFCRRLNQSCTYLPRTRADKPALVPIETARGLDQGDFESQVTDSSPLGHETWRPDDPEPSTEALQHLMSIYRDRIYFQPMPLFDPQSLEDKVPLFIHYVRWSLLALTLHFSTHQFYSGMNSEAIRLYTTFSRSVVQDLYMEGVASIEALQSLCLLAMCEILDGEHTRAWVTIGAASRLEALRLSQSRHAPFAPHSSDAISRCHWSIYALEKMFTPNFVIPGRKLNRPRFPRSPGVPDPIESHAIAKSHCPDISKNVQQDGSSPDLGINANCLGIVAIWGEIVAYLQDVRSGLVDCPWSNTSRHAKLGSSFYEFEVRVSTAHMLRHVSFPDRRVDEIRQKRAYWMPWLTMQVLYHASKAALDNPFVQLFALRGSNARTQPGSYLQKAIDQALFNYEWVARLIQMAQDASFELYDPLIGAAVAATATVPWFFQFSRDEQVAFKAKQNLELFKAFLSGLSLHWPHIEVKLKILQELVSLGGKRDESSAINTTIHFQPDLVWDVLCPTFSDVSPAVSDSIPHHSGSISPNAALHVTTQYMHPLIDPPANKPIDGSNIELSFGRFYDGLDGMFPEGYFF